MPHASSVQADIRSLLDRMISASQNNITVEKLACELELLVLAYVMPSTDDVWVTQYEATESEARILRLLHAKAGTAVAKHALMNALYYDKLGDEPESKIIDIFICRLRQKLRLKGCPYQIETEWGRGYRLVKAEKLAAAA